LPPAEVSRERQTSNTTIAHLVADYNGVRQPHGICYHKSECEAAVSLHFMGLYLNSASPLNKTVKKLDWARGAMKTLGEIEAAVCEGIARFEQDYMGRGPKDIHAYLIGDLLVVRLKGVLTVAEQQLVAALPAEKGRDLLKQVRIHLVETARPVMESMIQKITSVKVVSLHHDISTVTGEEVVLFTLANPPGVRETRK
jgi:uncharacterized protein YbcI